MPRPALLAACLLSLSLAAGCSSEDEVPAGLDVCHRLELVVADTGLPVIGPEDLAWDPVSGTLFISAHDRLGQGRSIPGIYAMKPDLLAGQVAEVRLVAAVDEPHGIGIDPDRRELAVVDHAGRTDDDLRLSTVRRFTVGPDGGLTEEGAYGTVLQANDAVPDGQGGAWVTRDHGSETRWGSWMENVFALSRSEVVRLPGGEAILTGLVFANGIARADGRLYVSATREEAVRVVEDGRPVRRLELPAGPDNLDLTDDGRLVAAVLPSPLRLGLALNGWIGPESVGSRVVILDPDDAAAEARLVLDDPAGLLLNGATSAEVVGERVVVGSVLDRALAVCPLPPASAVSP